MDADVESCFEQVYDHGVVKAAISSDDNKPWNSEAKVQCQYPGRSPLITNCHSAKAATLYLTNERKPD
jgi:hypothetical protein